MQVEKDLAVRISLDLSRLKKSMKELQSSVEHNMEKIEMDIKNSGKKASRKFDQATEKMEDDIQEVEKQAKRSADKMDNAFDGVKLNLTGKFSSALRTVGTLIATTFSVQKVYDFGKACVEASADIEAMQAAFEQIMTVELDNGEMKKYTQEANKYLNDMCDEFDMDINTLKGEFTDFTSQFKGLGYDIENAMAMSDDALRMSADAAAMFNIPLKDAIDHVRSFMNGNYIGGRSVQLFGSETAMKEYYENMDATTKKAYELSGAWDELTDKQKQAIRLDFGKHMYEQAGITGQASRESQLYLNQLTKLQQKWTNFKASLGDTIMPHVTGVFIKLAETFERIEGGNFMSRFSTFMATIGGNAIEVLGAGFEKVVTWIEKVDWATLGMQLETISGYVRDFLGAAWDVLTDELAPIIEEIMNAFGIETKDIEGMDSLNEFLIAVKPHFKWLADNGEDVARAVIDIGKAWATWKTINVTLGLGNTLLTIKKMGFANWIVEKIFDLSSDSAIGKAIAGGLSGSSGVIGALTIPIVLSLTFDYWGSEKQKDEVEERVDNRFGIQVGKDEHGKDKGKQLNNGEHFNAKETLESWKQFWSDLNEATGVGTDGVEIEMDKFQKEYGTYWGMVGENNGQVNFDWSEFWAGIPKTIGESLDNIYGKYFDPALQAIGRFFRGETGWQKTASKWWNGFWTGIIDSLVKKINEMSSWVGGIPGKLAKALAGKDGKFTSTLGQMFENAILKAQQKINQLIGVINNFLKSLGLETRLKSINVYKKKSTKNNPNKMNSGWQQEWATGTDNAPAGRSLVGEAGRELIADPKLGVFMADRPMVVDLSRGATVLKNSTTESLLRNMGIKAYAKGKNEGNFWDNIWDYLKKPNTVTDKIIENIGFGRSNVIMGALTDWVKGQARGNILSFVRNIFASDEVKNSPNNPNNNKFGGTGAGFGSAMTWARQALAIAGYRPMMQQYKDFMTAFKIVGQHESGYNNASINLWDINAKRGTPSAGWLQFIEPTFKAYARKGYTNWSNGMHQALAFINYANRRYGGPLGVPGVKSILRGGSYKPYANGGLITNPTMALMGEAGTEAVVPLSNAKALKPFGQSVVNAIKDESVTASGGVYQFTIPVIVDGRQIAVATATYTKEELDKLDKRNSRLKGRK